LRRAALATVLCALGAPASAEPLPPDLFAGYSFLDLDDVSRHGANVALGFRLFGAVSAFVDAGAHWGSDASLDRADLTAMAGPGVRFGKPGRTVLFARVLAGLVRDRASVSVLDVDISESSSRFGVLAGGGIDVPVASRWALRAQGDYLWNDVPDEDAALDGGSSSGFRVSAGIVYRFGQAR
jgi:opacity protein-like surface antigen